MLKIERLVKITELSGDQSKFKEEAEKKEHADLSRALRVVLSYPYHTNYITERQVKAVVTEFRKQVDNKSLVFLSENQDYVDIILASLLVLARHVSIKYHTPAELDALYTRLSSIKPVVKKVVPEPSPTPFVLINVFSDEQLDLLRKWFGRTNVLKGPKACVPESFGDVLVKLYNHVKLTQDEYKLLLSGHLQVVMLRLDIASWEEAIEVIKSTIRLRDVEGRTRVSSLSNEHIDYLAYYILDWNSDDEEELEGRVYSLTRNLIHDTFLIMEILGMTTD